MKVRQIIVENIELYLDYLEKELCQKGISYVRIDNELHFFDQIIRFYDFDKDMRTIIKLSFLNINIEIEEKLLSSPKTFFQLQPKAFKSMFISTIENVDYTKAERNHQTRNKVIQKMESNQTNQKLKRYQR